jgi:hypothetical protein
MQSAWIHLELDLLERRQTAHSMNRGTVFRFVLNLSLGQ